MKGKQMTLQEKASWVLVRILENDPSKYDSLTESEVIFYLEGWGEDCSEEIISEVLNLHRK